MPGRKSPYGIQVDSPDQRQWISFESMGSIRRIASSVWGASGSQRALKCRSPTAIRSVLIDPEDSVAADAGQPRPTISTHVLDTERGVPATGVRVTLYRLGVGGNGPIRMTQALTDADGRVRDLLERPLQVGDYRLEFDVANDDGSF